MAKEQKSFVKGRMNKSVDERLLPDGEYVDAQNLRLGSTELTEVGSGENTKGNVKLTTLQYKGDDLSGEAVCIGAFADDARETVYWFVHDPFNDTAGGVVDMIVSFNTQSQQLTYHVVSTSVLNFNPTYRVNAVNLIDNLLFFTDDYNQPRKINIKRAYPQPNASHIDLITDLDISVIKPQPVSSPNILLQANQANDNFMEDTFLCFAYRYKYKDGEYSPTSQFSEPAFMPSEFSLERRSYMNAGMENSINSVVVEFDTGNDNVVGIDVLFKESDSSTIYVAKKLNKVTQGYQNNSTQSITFSNGDIYTILNEGEILRLYDNVPRLAKAQTIMGNRLMYGNYLEGYDLKDSDGRDIQLTYVAEQMSETANSFVKDLDRSCQLCLFLYNYGLTGSTTLGATNRDNEILVDLSGIPVEDLVNGAQLSVAIEVRPNFVFTSNPASDPNISQFYYPYVNNPIEEIPIALRQTTTIEFSYTLTGSYYPDVTSAFTGTAWDETIGFPNLYQQDPLDSENGFTVTDNYNATFGLQSVPPVLNGSGYTPLTLQRSAYDNQTGGDPLRIYVDGGFLHVLPNGFQYKDDNGNDNIYMIPDLVSVKATFTKSGNQRSLHSNRDYQVGIVYQDAEGRQSTALESISNSFHVPAYDSENVNWAKITIPSSMNPPYWADRYKFVMKQTETDYETVFVTTYYRDIIEDDSSNTVLTGNAWLLLEGENSNKVKEGQELYIKMDSSGAPDSPVKTTVLEVKQFADNDLADFSPAGVYMKVFPDNFSLEFDSVGNVLTNGLIAETTGAGDGNGFPPLLRYPVHTDGVPWFIPAGSRVVFDIHIHRREYDRIEQDVCGRETCNFKFEGYAYQDYNNLWEFWMGQSIDITNESDCGPWGYDDDSGPNQQIFYSNVFDYNPSPTGTGNHFTGFPSQESNKYQFTTDSSAAGGFWFEIQSGTRQCPSVAPALRRTSKVECTITIYPTVPQLVFETIPTVTTGEVYYENSESFEIVGGNHMSGNHPDDVDQDVSGNIDGVVNLGFHNCITFFNGVESYKIKDSIVGKKFYLGNRVTAVSEQDYKEIRRNASITYSGIFNAQNNVNKLNEFNLGLANYKDCEDSYGPIQVLHGRRTDLLTLQEDRISYVSVGKNILTDAVGGGIVASIPEVLGTQIARIEEYGISENPESFCHYGKDVYFTDAKRSSVIQLRGGDGIDSLSVISDMGMDTWFRDLFQTSFNRQKLGGYDPYMNEYVLSANTNKLPFDIPVYECGGGDIQFTGLLDTQTFIIDFGNTFGDVFVFGNASVATDVSVEYDGNTFSDSTDPSGNFSITFDKNVPSITQATVTITPTSPASDSVTFINSINCPVADFIRVIPVVVTSQADAGRTRTQLFRFLDPTSGYLSPIWQDLNLTFASQTPPNIVSKFGPEISGFQGTGMIPMDLANVTMYSARNSVSDFTFDLNRNTMRFLRTNTVYNNNPSDIAALLSASAPASITGTEPLVAGTFPMPAGNESRLYLIWDYREIKEIKLCYSATSSVDEACCECFSAPNCIPFEGSVISPTVSGSAAACALPNNTSVYHTSVIVNNGVANTIPVIGTTIFGAGGCSFNDPNRELFNAGFIHFDDNGTSKWIEIDSNNVVIDSGNC